MESAWEVEREIYDDDFSVYMGTVQLPELVGPKPKCQTNRRLQRFDRKLTAFRMFNYQF